MFHAKSFGAWRAVTGGMPISIGLPFQQCVLLLRQALQRTGLETSYEWNAAQDLRDSMGPQVADLRCIYVFEGGALLHHCQAAQPARALATVTVASVAAGLTEITVEGQGRSFKMACHALASLRQQLSHLRHAA